MADQQAGDDFLRRCLERNHQWAEAIAQKDPEFFPNLAKGQAPKVLWLGCSDSRKPETTIMGLQPGDVFTHRNIANMVHPADLSLLSVVEFAVAHLKVAHIMLCGHTICGGVKATLANDSLGPLDTWLHPMRVLREQHADALAPLTPDDQTTQLARLNVRHGVETLRRIPTVMAAVRDRGLQVHGLMYDLRNGRLDEVACDEDPAVAQKRIAAFGMK